MGLIFYRLLSGDLPLRSRIEVTTCPRCDESRHLGKIKGCIVCLRCHFKFDCTGW